MGALRVYIVDTLDKSFTENREALASSLSTFRRNKLSRFSMTEADKDARHMKATNYDLCLAAGLVTDIGLSTYGLREKDMKYGLNPHGKPVFLNHPDIKFNISHSGHFAVAAFSEEFDPGIDIERCSRISNRIIYSFFTEGERRLILSQQNELEQSRMFGRIWTVREAFMKATGLGLSAGREGYEAVLKDGRLAISQNLFDGEFGTYEMNPVGEYCISVVGARNVKTGVQALQ